MHDPIARGFVYLLQMAKRDKVIIKSSVSSAFESEADLFKAKKTSQYKLELVDHPKAGNLSFQNSLTRLSYSRLLSPRQSVSSPFGSSINLLSSAKQSPKASNNNLKSMASISKLSRSAEGSSAHLNLPVDKTHEKSIHDYSEKRGSFSVDDFMIIRKSSSQHTAVLEDYELNDQDGTLAFQLLSIDNTNAILKREMLMELVKKTRSISYIFISSLLCVLPSSDSLIFVLDWHSSNLQKILNQNNVSTISKALMSRDVYQRIQPNSIRQKSY